MRLIGTLHDKNRARIFGDYLYSQDIDNHVNSEDGRVWEIWVVSEDDIERAKTLLDEFLMNPDDSQYRDAQKIASQKRVQVQKDEESYQKRFIQKKDIFKDKKALLTLILIAISVIVTLISGFGNNISHLKYLLITSTEVTGGYIRYFRGLQEIQSGQIWRIFTPMFIHFGILHIVFNMLWLKDLGSMIEFKQGSWFLGIMVLVLAGFSNLGQYYVSGPLFGGMSGVVYGLLGYIWIRGKYDPFSGYFLHPHTVIFMMIWFFLGLFGVIGHIANTAHGVGLGVGCAWGFIAAKLHHTI